MATEFLATPGQLHAKVEQWRSIAGPRLRVDHVHAFSGHRVYALTLSDFDVPRERKRTCYFAQPHAHEPGSTAGMIDAIEQLVTGRDLAGEPTELHVDRVLAETILTFNPIGNPHGRERSPVPVWDGSTHSNKQLGCCMRGEDPDNPGEYWHRFDVWDRREVRAPDPVGIVYEPIDEYRYVEPNRSHESSYFRLFFKMDQQYRYERWLDLHQMQFEHGENANCIVLLPIEGLASGAIEAANRRWAQGITDVWVRAGHDAMAPKPLSYTGTQAEYFRKTWGELHKRMNIVAVEVKQNAADAPAEFQLAATSQAVTETIRQLVC